jgi:hypothetical protein
MAVVALDSSRLELLEDVRCARERVEQLEFALGSRIVIEQAKGVLRERLDLPVEDAVELLRYAARSFGLNIHDLAARVVAEPTTPAPIVVALARQSRWRAALSRERAEGQRQRLEELRAAVNAQNERLVAALGANGGASAGLLATDTRTPRRRSLPDPIGLTPSQPD